MSTVIPTPKNNNQDAFSQQEPIRHLLVFIDGTWVSANNEPEIDNNVSNIYKLAVSTNTNADTSDGSYQAQIGFYLSGIGSGNRKYSEGILATELPYDIMRAYTNICLNYIPDMGYGAGDKIYLFGFSRGAFIARAAATLIAKFGLLKQDHLSYFSDLWNLISADETAINEFKEAHCHPHPDGGYDTKITFLGLFDTVFGTYGGKWRHQISKLVANSKSMPVNIEKCVHILAADEDRAVFSPSLWSGVEDGNAQILEQIWMPGAHTDIGGGYSNRFLSDVSLLTMLDRIMHYTELGIDSDYVTELREKVEKLDTEEVIIHYERKPWLYFFDAYTRQKRQIDASKIEPSCQFMSPIVDLLHQKKIFRQSFRRNINFNKNEFFIRKHIRLNSFLKSSDSSSLA